MAVEAVESIFGVVMVGGFLMNLGCNLRVNTNN